MRCRGMPAAKRPRSFSTRIRPSRFEIYTYSSRIVSSVKMPEPLAYLNGRISPVAQTLLPVWDMGVVTGASITEMARTFRHECFRLRDHVERLFRSLKHV